MNVNSILWLLSGDTTVMYELLADTPELVSKAKEVAENKANYNDLLELSYKYF